MTRIILSTYKDDETGQILVSHGINADTMQNVCLPNEPLSAFRPFKSEGGDIYIENGITNDIDAEPPLPSRLKF